MLSLSYFVYLTLQNITVYLIILVDIWFSLVLNSIPMNVLEHAFYWTYLHIVALFYSMELLDHKMGVHLLC